MRKKRQQEALRAQILLPRREKLLELRRQMTNLEEIDKINETIKAIDIIIQPDERNFSEKFLDEYDAMVRGGKFLNVIRPLAGKEQILPYVEISNYNLINRNVMFELVQEFFETVLSPKTYSLFSEFFDMRNSHIFLGNYDTPETLFIEYLKEPIIISIDNKTVDDIASLAHEFGHAIHFLVGSKYDYTCESEDDTFVEIVSMIFEIMFMDFLRSKKHFCRQARKLQLKYQNSVLADVRKAFLAQGLYERIYEEQARMGIYIEECSSFRSNIIDRVKLGLLLKDTPAESIKYSLGYLVGIELLYAYFKDHDKAREMIDGIMELDVSIDSMDYFYDLIDFGVNPGEHLMRYRSYLKTDRSKCFTKKL